MHSVFAAAKKENNEAVELAAEQLAEVIFSAITEREHKRKKKVADIKSLKK